MKKILITDAMHPLLKEGLIALGYSCDEVPLISYIETLQRVQWYHGMVVSSRMEVNRELIDHATSLKFIGRAGSGMENIDVAYATSKRIVCISSPEGNANSVGEHALGLLLAMYHNIVKSHLQTTQEQWLVEENRVHELEGRTMGIIGYGNTGRSFAQKLQPFNMKVLTFDKYLNDYSDQFARQSVMNEIFSAADSISFHIPLTEETRWMVNADYLQRFQKPVHLINTSRGKIIRHADLLQLIQRGKVSGAALDVFENENFDHHTREEREVFKALIQTGKVIFTPHVAGKSFEANEKIAEVLVKKIGQLG